VKAIVNANWNYPTDIRSGVGRIAELPEICRELGITAPLLVTDSGLATMPFVAGAIEGLVSADLRCSLFCDVQPNPTGANVVAGVKAFRAGDHDGVVAIGGGSGLDAGKAIALMAQQICSIWELEDVGDNFKRADAESIAPVIAIPTTAGTGSEVGRASVILDEEAEVKRIIFHPRMLPRVVVLDPELTVGLPAQLTAATGMDALSHSLEAYCSPMFHPLAEGIAVEGIRLVFEFLPRAVANGRDIEARQNMLVTASMGATAFQRGLGAMHALAHPLGALYNAHHGMLNAILMPYVLRANRREISERVVRLSRYLDLPEPGFDGFLSGVLRLREELGIPHSLSAIGIDTGQSERVGAMAAEDPSAGTNPMQFSAQDYTAIFQAAIKGDLMAFQE
jgi:alcohol dehydrogenase class IV